VNKIKIKKKKLKISPETRNFLISFIVAALITYLLTYTEIWQLVIIPGIIAGVFNKTMRRGIYSGALSVSIVWFFFMIYQMSVNSAYTNLDQFAAFIFGDLGYGWVIFILVLLLGVLLGALGGGIGSGIMILIRPKLKGVSLRFFKSKNSAANTGNLKK
jgi:hypothetical protein